MPQIHFETLGCKVNQIESEGSAKAFLDQGFTVDIKNWTAKEKIHTQTLLVIINTCTVTAKAEQKARRIIRLMLDLCPNSCILVTGCYAQVDKDEIKIMHDRIVVLPGTQKDLLSVLPTYLKNSLNAKIDIVQFIKNFLSQQLPQFPKNSIFALSTDTFLQHSRSSIKIQDGCNNSCTFCRIHIARGSSVSLEPQKVLEQVQKLENAGQWEVVLTGVNLTQYLALNPKYDSLQKNNSELPNIDKYFNLPKLIKYLLDNTEKISFRLSSLYPQSITDEFCQVINNNRVQSHFHLSVQSGSDKILQIMARPYKANDVKNAVEKLRAIKPNAFIACDIIAGFAGEMEDDFKATVDLCKKCNFTWIHAFPFSPRPGTPGFYMTPKIPQYIAGNRVKELTDLALKNKNNFVNNLVGQSFFAIVENRKSSVIRAVTENFLHVQVIFAQDMPTKELSGRILVKIIGQSKIKGCDALAQLI